MDKNKSPKGRKRQSKTVEPDFLWDCSVCTYRNSPEAFKCVMCDVRKGTSTRKSRINPDLVAVQVQQALLPPPPPLKLPRESGGSARQVHEADTGSEGGDSGPSPGPSSSGRQSSSKSGAGSRSSASNSGKGSREQQQQPPSSSNSNSTPTNTTSSSNSSSSSGNRSKFKNVDRANATTMEVTVDDVTVVITEYKLLQNKTSAISDSEQAKDNQTECETTRSS